MVTKEMTYADFDARMIQELELRDEFSNPFQASCWDEWALTALAVAAFAIGQAGAGISATAAAINNWSNGC